MSSSRDFVSRTPVQGGATDQLRRSNLSNILGLVHREGPLSRAELTRLTGLNRSTVGDLVAELTDLGLVYEAMPTTGNVPGRPSPIVHAQSGVVAIAINPEVDAIHVGLVGMSGRVLAKVRLEAASAPTPADVVRLASAAIAGLLSGRETALRVVGIGVAVPGQVRVSDGTVREATHMGWAEEPLSRMLSQATTFPAWAANAANLAMRAESVFGAGKGVDDFVYFIGGASGIGGGAITGGRLLSGAAGYAGEFGHSFVRSDGTQCPCGATGCLEAEVTQARLLEAVGLAPAEAGLLGTRLVSSRDPGVRALISEQLDLLAIAVRTAVNLFNPTLVVLGGFLGDLYDAGGREGDALLRDAIRSAREDVRIEGAASASDQLLIGCGELVFSELIADPASLPRN
ncbi:ROK family transcriptional regulator [Lacisediminihabitans sp.]|jgi:predicted NBD/HSP70 family sugar kinase|uniref:ROK family transcriptional regulator n=1 Tax=Lacisediminihabitans sp. TaxID=2787631 RepID=UPI002F94FBA4